MLRSICFHPNKSLVLDCLPRPRRCRHRGLDTLRASLTSWALILGGWMILGGAAPADDWPTYRNDQRRSGSTEEQLDAARLVEVWCWRSSLPPAPAWPDAARWDAYATLDGLRSMRNYDPVFHPVVVGQRVYIPSNSQDTLRCLSLANGEELWRYTTDAPMRIAPTIYLQRVYLGADDGSVHCLHADTGELVWRQQVGTRRETFINDGRICSLEPVRTGVLIDAQASLAIVAAGMFPWRTTYLVAMDVEDGTERWRQDLGKGWSLEGAMLLADQRIVAPQGRAAPQLFERATGQPLGPLEGGGGSFVVLTDDDEVVHGPGNKGGWITQSRLGSRERIATFERGTALVVQAGRAYLMDDLRLSAIDRESGYVAWSIDSDCPHELIRAGTALFAGGNDRVRAFDSEDGRLLWEGVVEGRAQGLAVANGHLLVSTDAGTIHAFAPTGDPQRHQRVATTPETQHPFSFLLPAPPPLPDDDPHLLDRWVFHADRVIGIGKDKKRKAVAALSNAATDPSQASEETGNHAPLSDRCQFVQAGTEQALLLDGRTDCAIASSYRRTPHPTQAVTALAWVRIDQPQPLGSIVAMAARDEDHLEGWLLGFRDDQFGFAINGRQGAEAEAWVSSPHSRFQPGAWYLVVGTYDGGEAHLYLNGQLVASSTAQQGPIRYPIRAAYHLGGYKDGEVQSRVEGMLNEVRVYERALTAAEVQQLYAEKQSRFPEPASEVELTERSKYDGAVPSSLYRGPFLEFTAPRTATVRWWTNAPQPTNIQLQPHAYSRATIRTMDQQPTTEHVAIIENVRHHELIKYRIGYQSAGESQWTGYYECDGHFDFQRPPLPASELAAEIVSAARTTWELTEHTEPRGLAIVVGAQDQARFAEALCRLSGVDVIVLEADTHRVAEARRRLLNAGVYGRPVCIRQIDDFASLGIPNRTADFLVFTPDLTGTGAANSWTSSLGSVSIEQLCLKVQPQGAIVLPAAVLPEERIIVDEDGQRLVRTSLPEHHAVRLRIPPRSGAASWTHMYGAADNSAFAGETLAGASTQDDLTLVWAGRPGPRYQSDRGNRKPSPLATAGRLYMQGLRRIISVDAFNGAILWSLELPEVIRFNVPRDCSNWCADEQHLYVAAGSRCLVIEAATGRIAAQWNVFQPDSVNQDWGYLAREGALLIGSSVARGAAFTEFWGGEYWYDEKIGEHTKKVCSSALFGADHRSGDIAWTYTNGLIVNSTLSIAEGKIFFLECRSDLLKSQAARRLEGDEFWQHMHLVALDARTGQVQWEVPARPMEGKVAVHLAYGSGKLVLVTSKDGAFGVYALNSANGENLWRGRFDWEVDHHGKHLSRPAIVDGNIYLRPLTLDLNSGRVLSQQFPQGHQCGTYSASQYALFLRAGELAIWDRQTGESARWDRVRPDCWISTIPAEGMLLSPEGGGGCSCGGWIETSMAFAPTQVQGFGGTD